MKHYLLTGEKWIPVVRRGGTFCDVSLLELFEEGREILDLSVPPAERIALMRLLLCIVARSLPLPQTRREWESAQDRIAPRAIAYLKEWEGAFDLYGEHPFLQVVGLEIEWNSTLDKLDFTLASGNNHTLFDHLASEKGRPHPPARQARMLLVTQNFSPGGLIGPNKWNQVSTNELTGNISSPALEGSPLHTFLLGGDILETLHLNLIPVEELAPLKIGVPVWEKFPDDAKEAQLFRDTLLGRLAPLSRAVRLPEEGNAVSLAVGCNYAQIPEFLDPYLANCRNEKKGTLFYLRIQPERHPWRELESLLALQSSSSDVTPPKHLQNRHRIAADGELRLWCGGVAVDKAKYVFAGEWQLSFSAKELSEDEFLVSVGRFARAAEEVAGVIKSSIDFFWKNLSEIPNKDAAVKIRAGKDQAKARAILGYWQRLDAQVPEFIASAEEGSHEFSELYRMLRNTAETFFTGALPDQSPYGIIAYAKTIPYFRKELKCILGDQITEKGEREDGE